MNIIWPTFECIVLRNFKFTFIIFKQVWAADIVSSNADNTQFVLKNKDFSADVAKNDEIVVEFQGNKGGTHDPTGTITIKGAGALGSGGGSNTGGQTSSPNGGQGGTQAPYTGQGSTLHIIHMSVTC